MLVVIKHGTREKAFGAGDVLLGRSSECDFLVEDPLVSRRHARMVVTPDAIWIDDLESANGVFVRGERITARRRLEVGERLFLGSAEVVVRPVPSAEAPARDYDAHPPTQSGDHVRPAVGETAAHSDSEQPFDEDDNPSETRRASMFELLTDYTDKAFAAGRVADAERLLVGQLRSPLTAARAGKAVPVTTVDWCVQQALRLARGTAKGAWVDYAVESYLHARRAMPAAIVDDLYSLLRIAKPIDVALLRRYVAVLAELESTLAPNERFLVRRIAGLERMALAG